jgi:inorganic pyrophosphatase
LPSVYVSSFACIFVKIEIMTQHPWHEVDPKYNSNERSVQGIVEIPKGSKAKYEVDKESGLIRLDRVVFAAFVYPINYGFIPQSLGDDGDPLDILILSEVSITPLCLVKTKVIGVMEMTDNGEGDEKIIAVAQGDMSVSHVNHVNDLPASFISELKHFFMNYKTLSKKEVRVDEFLGPEAALRIIEKSFHTYQSTFRK